MCPKGLLYLLDILCLPFEKYDIVCRVGKKFLLGVDF